MRVYINTDLEGCSGITLFDQTRNSSGPRYPESCRLLMGDLNAAVEGALDGGAKEVWVLDGHGNPLNVVPELMDPAAEWICGRGFPAGWGLDDGFACAFLVGYHAMARTPDGVLCHTQSSRSDAATGTTAGSSGRSARRPSSWGTSASPSPLVTGDVAACREAREFLGEEIVTVAVKEGYSRECCRMIAPARAHELIREGAKGAMQRIARCRPFKMDLPMPGRCEYLEELLPDGPTPPNLDELPHVVKEKTFEDQLDIYSF